jgi:hypothetical protein
MGAKTFSGLISANGGIALSGSGATITAASSVTASGFFGNGSGLSGVTAAQVAASGVQAGALGPSVMASSVAAGAVGTVQLADSGVTNSKLAGAISQSKVTNLEADLAAKIARSGDAMTGQLTLRGSTLTITGNALSVGVSTLVVAGGKVGVGTASPAYTLEVNGDARFGGELRFGISDSRTFSRNDAGLRGDAGAQSGFFQTDAPSPAANWPAGAGGWWHLLDVRHSNPANNYAMQFSGSFFDQDLYFRKTSDNPSMPWNKFVFQNGSGKVGIGTTAPNARLHVSSAAAVASDFILRVSSGTGPGQDLLSVKGDGKVGVGTTSPGFLLDVNGSIGGKIDGVNSGVLRMAYGSGTPSGYYATYAP